MTTDLNSLQQRVDQIEQTYRANFAGHPRITRETSLLDTLISDSQALLGGATDGALADRIKTNIELYTRELDEVKKAQAQGPDHITLARINSWGRLLRNRYLRHFGGQSRNTRDAGLLLDIIKHQDRLLQQLDGLKNVGDNTSLRESIKNNQDLFKRELGEIRKARAAGTVGERSGRLATLANEQLALYRTHFAGHPRVSRSVELLDRISDTIVELRTEMAMLKESGFNSDANDGNIKLLRERLDMYSSERDQIEAAKAAQGLVNVANELGNAANKVMEDYRNEFAGHPRNTRDPSKLIPLIEALIVIAREMDDLQGKAGVPEHNSRNLRVVMDRIRLYDREFDAIVEAKKQQG